MANGALCGRGLPRGPKRPLSVERGLFLASWWVQREASLARKTLARAPRAPKGHKGPSTTLENDLKKILASLCGKRPLWPPEASKEASLWPLERHVWPPQRPVWPPERPTWLPQREKSLFGLPRGPKRPLSVERGLFDFPRGPKRGSLASREASFFGFPRKTLERAPRAPKGHKRAPKRL